MKYSKTHTYSSTNNKDVIYFWNDKQKKHIKKLTIMYLLPYIPNKIWSFRVGAAHAESRRTSWTFSLFAKQLTLFLTYKLENILAVFLP